MQLSGGHHLVIGRSSCSIKPSAAANLRAAAAARFWDPLVLGTEPAAAHCVGRFPGPLGPFLGLTQCAAAGARINTSGTQNRAAVMAPKFAAADGRGQCTSRFQQSTAARLSAARRSAHDERVYEDNPIAA